MKLNLSVDEVLTTTRTVRKRLDLSKPVPRAIIEECLELALQAPNGSNLNVWRWIVVDDRATIAAIAGIYKAGLEVYAKDHYRANSGVPDEAKLMDSAMTLLRVMDRVPAMLVPLMVSADNLLSVSNEDRAAVTLAAVSDTENAVTFALVCKPAAADTAALGFAV